VLGMCKSRLTSGRFLTSRKGAIVFVLLCLVARCGKAAETRHGGQPALTGQATSQFAIADFDGDTRPDLATVETGVTSASDTRYWIAFRLSGGLRQILGITAPTGGLQLTSRDVNGDDFLDVVVTTAWTNRPVAVLLNDGHGKFTASDPSAFLGAFPTSEDSLFLTKAEIKDACDALFSRYSSGDCEQSSRVAAPQKLAGLCTEEAHPGLLFYLVSPFLGRAPPYSSLHI